MKVFTQENWDEIKNEGDWDFTVLPIAHYVDASGKNHYLGQTGAILRSYGIRFGYYNPLDWKESRLVDPIIDTWNSLVTSQFKTVQMCSSSALGVDSVN